MTATELQNIVRILANQSWCRYWLNLGDRHENVLMAIQCLEGSQNGATPVQVKCLEEKGFEISPADEPTSRWIYTIPRTNDDGTPFVSRIF